MRAHQQVKSHPTNDVVILVTMLEKRQFPSNQLGDFSTYPQTAPCLMDAAHTLFSMQLSAFQRRQDAQLSSWSIVAWVAAETISLRVHHEMIGSRQAYPPCVYALRKWLLGYAMFEGLLRELSRTRNWKKIITFICTCDQCIGIRCRLQHPKLEAIS